MSILPTCRHKKASQCDNATVVKKHSWERRSMKREFLNELGLEKEVIDKIMAENGKDIEAEKAKTTAEGEKLKAANETIQGLQETVKKFDGVDVQKLKDDLAAAETKYNTDINNLKLETALEMALTTGKAKNSKAVKALLNMEEIKLDGDKLLGLEEQITKLKADNAYLFDIADSSQTTVSTGAGHADSLGGDNDKFIAAAMRGAGIEQKDNK